MGGVLESVATIEDLRRIARRQLPDFAFLPMELGTGNGSGPRRNVAAFARYSIIPRIPETVVSPDLSTVVFGRTYALPFGISAIGYAGKMRACADISLAEAAAAANIPFLLSGGSVTPLETITKIAPGQVWQQLYVARDQAITDDFISRGIDCGCEVLVVTVDMPTPPSPDWLTQTGIKPPGAVRPSAFPHFLWQLLTHPNWCLQHARNGGMPMLESWARYAAAGAGSADIAAFFQSQVAPGVTWREIERIRKMWPGKFVVKGLLHADDICRAREAGADAITISNHGGNKIDTAITPLDVLEKYALERAAQAASPVFFDGGIRTGSDMVIVRALGADFSFVGRAILYGVLAAGRSGALKAIDVLRGQLSRSLHHLGCSSMDCLRAEHLHRS